MDPKYIHVVFKTHLDIGFTDLPHKVVAKYLNEYIPAALDTARKMRESGSQDRYIWTTGSWLIHEYLEQAAPVQRKRMEEAIQAGDLTWHALPFTAYWELMDASLFEYSLSLSQRLDERFGKKTIAAKMTDVPGTTRAVIPFLARAGVSFMHFGVNGASTVPEVPPVFRWQGAEGSEIVIAYQDSYGELLTIPGLEHALNFIFTNDNLGPHKAEDVISIFAGLRKQFPQAQVFASTMNAFAARVANVKDTLPLVTAEIGNTWGHGAGSDPKKLGAYRELSRLRWEWLAQKRAATDTPAFESFSRFLILVPEHTWGLDEKTHLAEYTVFRPDQLAKARLEPKFVLMEQSWAESRAYLSKAVDALESTPLADEARRRLAHIQADAPSHKGYEAVANLEQTFQTAHFSLGFDPKTGALNSMIDRRSGRQWAGADNLLGLFRHQSFSQEDYDLFLDQYLTHRYEWAIYDFSRPGAAAAGAKRAWRLPQLSRLWRKADKTGERFLLELETPAEGAGFGCPRRLTVELDLPTDNPRLDITLQWFDKPASRLPEALWFSFQPQGCQPDGWKLDKIGEMISPLDVVSKGSRGMHAVERGVFYRVGKESLAIESMDATLVSPGKPGILSFDNQLPDLAGGWHFNLYNNQWGTGIPAWYGEDARFRFSLVF